MKADVFQTCLRPCLRPEVIQPHAMPPRAFHGKDELRGRPRQGIQDVPRRPAQPDRAGTGLAIRQMEVPVPVEAPFQGQDLRLAAPGQEKQANRRHVQGMIHFTFNQHFAEAAVFLRGQEAFEASLPVTPDALAGIAVLRAVSPGFGLLHDDRQDRRRAVRRRRCRMERAKPLLDFLARDRPDGTPLEAGQDLAAKIGPVDLQGSRLPAPAIEDEDLLGDGLEQDCAGCFRVRLPAIAEGGQQFPGQGPRLGLGQCRRVADGLPDALPIALGMDEIAFRARGHDANAEALQLGIADIAHLAAGLEGVDPALGEAGCWHGDISPICCSGVRKGLPFRARWR